MSTLSLKNVRQWRVLFRNVAGKLLFVALSACTVVVIGRGTFVMAETNGLNPLKMAIFILLLVL